MSDCLNFTSEDKINPYYGEAAIDKAKAIEEHNHIKELLLSIGCDVVSVPSPSDSQDGVYTANWALVRDGKAVLARLPNVRKSEELFAMNLLTKMGIEVHTVPEDWKFSGQGDSLPCGNLLFAGSKYRSDPRAQEFAAKTLGFHLIQLQTIPDTDSRENPVINSVTGWPDSFFYDIDLALAVIKRPSASSKGLIAYCKDAFTTESQRIIEDLDEVDKIVVSIDEATKGFACNLISNGQEVVMSSHAPELKSRLEELGLTTHTPEINELSKGGGYIRCTSLTIN